MAICQEADLFTIIVRGTSDRVGSTFGRWGVIGLEEDGGFLSCRIAEGLGINLDLGRYRRAVFCVR